MPIDRAFWRLKKPRKTDFLSLKYVVVEYVDTSTAIE